LPGAEGTTSEPKPPENAADSTSSGAVQPLQPQGDSGEPTVHEPSAANDDGNGAAADDARGPEPAVAG
jgi:hypothetical protein